jgi:hypothetical protein
MSLNSLYDSLSEALHDATIILGANIPPGIAPVLACFRLTSLRLDQAELTLGPDTIVLKGQASFHS